MKKQTTLNHKLNRRVMIKLSAAMAGGFLFSAMNPKKNIILRSIPSTGEKVPAIGLGTWQTFDTGESQSERAPLKEVLKIFAEKGGKVIDSSPMYGRSEEVVGNLVAELNLHDQFFMATKVWISGKSQGIGQMSESMKLMRSNPMDLMQIHNLLDWKTHIKTLNAWKEEGKIRYIGITHYHDGAHPQLEEVMKQEKPDFVQLNYSITSREAEKRLLPLAKETGIAVLVNQPFDSGNLFRKTSNQSIPDWAKDYEIQSWSQFFLKFIIAHEAITCAIPGTSKPHHMLDNISAAYGPLPDEKTRSKMACFIKDL